MLFDTYNKETVSFTPTLNSSTPMKVNHYMTLDKDKKKEQ